MFDTTLTTNLRPDLSVFVAALHRGKEKHTDSQLVGCLKGNCLRGEHALGRACASFVSVCKKANMLSGGSTNGPRAAQRSLSLNDPPQLAVQSKSLAQQKLLNAQTIFDHNPSIHLFRGTEMYVSSLQHSQICRLTFPSQSCLNLCNASATQASI